MAFDIDTWAKSPAARRFQCFHPALTYSNSDHDCFVRPNGKPCRELNPDSEALFGIGKEAFERLTRGSECSKDEFDKVYAGYWESLEAFREAICEMHASGKLVVLGDSGRERLAEDIQNIDDTEIASICWKVFVTPFGRIMNNEDKELFRVFFLFHALREIDNALIGMDLDGREAIAAAIGAANALANSIAIESGSDKEQEIRRDMGYRSAMEKLKRDPKQAEKTFVYSCWGEWQKKPESYKGKAAFARDMLDKCEHLTSQKKIEDWCREWEKKNSIKLAE
jgi:hypothetical protein